MRSRVKRRQLIDENRAVPRSFKHEYSVGSQYDFPTQLFPNGLGKLENFCNTEKFSWRCLKLNRFTDSSAVSYEL